MRKLSAGAISQQDVAMNECSMIDDDTFFSFVTIVGSSVNFAAIENFVI